jgi:hypothetical protein
MCQQNYFRVTLSLPLIDSRSAFKNELPAGRISGWAQLQNQFKGGRLGRFAARDGFAPKKAELGSGG